MKYAHLDFYISKTKRIVNDSQCAFTKVYECHLTAQRSDLILLYDR